MANYQNNIRYNRMSSPCSIQQRQTSGTTVMPKESCNCTRETHNKSFEQDCTENLSEMPLAMAYVPWQKWQNIYEICKGFHRGTIFSELDKPFLGRGGCNR